MKGEAPARSAPGPLGPERGGLVGSLGDVSLVEILQLLNFGRRSGAIDVEPQSEQGLPLPRGLVVVDAGQVRFAKAGGAVGEDALFALLSAGRGRFSVRFERNVVDVPNVTAETQFLLLEFLRRADEAAAKDAELGGSAQTGTISASTSSWLVASPLPQTAPAAAPVATLPPAAPQTTPTKRRRKAEMPPRPEHDAPPPSPSGRFARFFDEATNSQLTPPPSKAAPSTPPPSSSSNSSSSKAPPLPKAKAAPKAPPPPPMDDDDADPLAPAATERFSSLAITMGTLSNTNGFERDTDIVDRALISA
jgi:hypothetical protein